MDLSEFLGLQTDFMPKLSIKVSGILFSGFSFVFVMFLCKFRGILKCPIKLVAVSISLIEFA